MSALNIKSDLNRLFPFAKKKPNIPIKQSDKVDPTSNKQKLVDDNNVFINKTSETTRCDVLTENNEKVKHVPEKSFSNGTSIQSLSEISKNDNLEIKPKIKKSVGRKLSCASVTSIEGTKKPKENYQRWNIPFSSKFKGQDFDKKLLTMQDLIYYNPVTNPIVKETKDEQYDEDDDDPDNDLLPIKSGESDQKPSVSNNCITPCIKVGPDGKIIIDQETLTLNETGIEEKREELAKAKVIEVSGSRYNSYKSKQKSTKQWTKGETLKFYKCLMNLGTDFSMIEQYFPDRTRAQIKRKYKTEEKKNPQLINSALSNTTHYDSGLINDMLREDEPEINVNADSEVSTLKKTENNTGSEVSKHNETEDINSKITTRQKRASNKRKHNDIKRSQCSRISVCAYMLEEELVLKKKRKVSKTNCSAHNVKDVLLSIKKKRGRPFKNKVKSPSDSDMLNIDKKEKEKPIPKVRRLQDFHEEYAENIDKYKEDSNSE